MTTRQEALNAAERDPTIRHVVPVSGGKDSAALALYMSRRYPDLPLEYAFSDTNCELEETYDYLDRLEVVLGKKIARLSALDVLGAARKPNRNAFHVVLNERYGGFLPSPRMRWCTRYLKIKPFEQFVAKDTAFSYIAIRGDENREGYIPKKNPAVSDKPNIIPVYPFKDDGVTLSDVKRILDEGGLGLPAYYEWRSRSGCYFCFYQMIGEWQGLMERHPDLFERAKSYEKHVDGRQYTWCAKRSLEEIAKLDKRYPVPSMDEVEGCAICHL